MRSPCTRPRALLCALLLGLGGLACQPPLPVTPCGGDPDCPPGARCAIELGVCASEDASAPEDATVAGDR